MNKNYFRIFLISVLINLNLYAVSNQNQQQSNNVSRESIQKKEFASSSKETIDTLTLRSFTPSPKASLNYTPYKYSYDLASDFDIRDEVYQIRNGDISSPLLMLIMFQNSELSDTGYKLCLSSGRPEEQCFYALGGVNIGYGICMAAHRNQEDCVLAKGGNNLGFGYCMASKFGNLELCKQALGGNNFGFGLCAASKYTKNPYTDCQKALGADNTGYGLCLAAGRTEQECQSSLGHSNIGFGLCMADISNSASECSKSIGNKNLLGYGLCMASRESPDNCAKALNNTNLGFGVCMAGVGKSYLCDQSLGSLNTGFGMCMAAGRSEHYCDDLLGAENIGYGICMAATMPDGSRINESVCDEALGADNTGFGLCMSSGRPDPFLSSTETPSSDYDYNLNSRYCKRALGRDNTGFGLCMLNPRNSYNDCNNGLGFTNIGFGLCKLSGGYNSDCYQTLNNTSLGVGICMKTGRNENNCDEGLGGYNLGFGLCMSEYRNEISRCRDLKLSSLDSMESDFFISLSGGYLKPIHNTQINSSDSIKIELSLNPNYQYLNQLADLFVVAEVKSEEGKSQFYQKNGNTFNAWNLAFENLQPSQADVILKGTMKTAIFEGMLTNIKGTINLYYGYRLKNAPINDIKYNDARTISFTVK